MNRSLIPMGFVFLAVGLGVGYLMITQPQGLNPSWPLGAALLVPAVFAAGGLHMIAAGLGYPSVSAAMLKFILIGAAFLAAAVRLRRSREPN